MKADRAWICGVARSRVEGAANALGYPISEAPLDVATLEQLAVFIAALDVYSKRNPKYKDNWKRMGWRGMLFRIRERAERVWDDLWDWPAGPFEPVTTLKEPDVDDAIDLINFAGFLVRAARDGNRDGTWWGRP